MDSKREKPIQVEPIALMLLFICIGFGAISCIRYIPNPNPPTNQTPVPTAVPAVTPKPAISVTPLSAGEAIFIVRSFSKIPIAQGDNWTLANFTWETEGYDLTQPFAEVRLRGTADDPGLIFLYTSNLAFDRTLDWSTEASANASALKSCGNGINPHRRIKLQTENDAFVVSLSWDDEKMTLSTYRPSQVDALGRIREGETPVGQTSLPMRVPGTFGLARVLFDTPWKQSPFSERRGPLWNVFAAAKHGAEMELLSWTAKGEQHEPKRCPLGSS